MLTPSPYGRGPTHSPRSEGASYRQRVTSRTRQFGSSEGQRPGLRNSPIEPILLKFLRTLCGLGASTPPLTCANAPIHTLKRNSTTPRSTSAETTSSHADEPAVTRRGSETSPCLCQCRPTRRYFHPHAMSTNTSTAAGSDTAAPNVSQLSLLPSVRRPTALLHSPGPSDEPAASTGNVTTNTVTAAIEAINHRMPPLSHTRESSRGTSAHAAIRASALLSRLPA